MYLDLRKLKNDNIYFADAAHQRIKKVTPDGVVTTIAGNGNWGYSDGLGNNARFRNPYALALDANNDRSVLAFCRSAIGLAVGADISTKISERADKNYATQVFLSMTIGATRIEEEKLVEIVVSLSVQAIWTPMIKKTLIVNAPGKLWGGSGAVSYTHLTLPTKA